MVANVRFMVIRRTVSVYRVLQMRGGGHADVPCTSSALQQSRCGAL